MLYDDLVQPGEYICHYGVKGQKWGVRHDENERAHRLGKLATASAKAFNISNKALVKSQKRYDKKPTEKNKFALDVDKEVNKRLKNLAKSTLNDLKREHNKAVKAYGKDNVSDIHYNKKGDVDDYNKTRVALSAIGTIASAALMAQFVGFGIATNHDPSPTSMADNVYYSTYQHVYNEMKTNRARNA